jgi:predicted DNA-binding protein (MmcQ/YjbR family)
VEITMADTEKLQQKLRDLCLSLPETTETDSFGHPNFKAGNKTFAVYEWHKGRPLIAFRLDEPDRDAMLMDPAFFDPPYSQGKWVALWVDVEIDPALLTDLVMRSYRTVALKRMLKALDQEEP